MKNSFKAVMEPSISKHRMDKCSRELAKADLLRLSERAHMIVRSLTRPSSLATIGRRSSGWKKQV